MQSSDNPAEKKAYIPPVLVEVPMNDIVLGEAKQSYFTLDPDETGGEAGVGEE